MGTMLTEIKFLYDAFSVDHSRRNTKQAIIEDRLYYVKHGGGTYSHFALILRASCMEHTKISSK